MRAGDRTTNTPARTGGEEDDDEGGELQRDADVIDNDGGSRAGRGRDHRDGGGLGREGITSGDLDEDDGIILVVVQLGDVSLSTSDCLLGGGSRIG
jgi:hypothetical protein